MRWKLIGYNVLHSGRCTKKFCGGWIMFYFRFCILYVQFLNAKSYIKVKCVSTDTGFYGKLSVLVFQRFTVATCFESASVS